MRVMISNGDAMVELEVEGSYAPDVCSDLVHRAVEAYREAFDAVEADE